MKATINTEQFKDALKTIQIVCKGPSVTECLMTFSGEGIILEGASMGAYVKQMIDGTVEEVGAFVTNTAYLAGLRLSGKQTVLEGKRNQLRCVSGRARYDVEVIQDTARIESQRPMQQIETSVTLPATVLAGAMSKTAFTPSLNAQLDVKLETTDQHMKITVNDAFRAAFYKAEIPAMHAFDVCLPITFLSAIIGRMKGAVQIGAAGGLFRIQDGKTLAYHPIREPAFESDIEGYIASLAHTGTLLSQAVLKTDELTGAIDSASSIISGTVGYEVRLEVNMLTQGASKVFVKSSIGEAECEFNKESLTKDAQMILSSKYLSDFLRLIKGKLNLDIHSSLILIHIVTPTEQLTLVMPQIESGI